MKGAEIEFLSNFSTYPHDSTLNSVIYGTVASELGRGIGSPKDSGSKAKLAFMDKIAR